MAYSFSQFQNQYLNSQMQRDPEKNEWGQILSRVFQEGAALDILEIGTFEGRTACWISDNLLHHVNSTLDCVDCFAYEVTADHTIANLSQSKNFEKVTLHQTTSSAFFKSNQKHYDLIYVDGDHSFAQALDDCSNSARFLKPNGILIVDDVKFYHDGVSRALGLLERKWSLICIQDALRGHYYQAVYQSPPL